MHLRIPLTSCFVAAVVLLQGLPLPLLSQAVPSSSLVITVLAGAGSSMGGKHPTPQPLTIHVETATHQPVIGALVFFAAPNYGASGSFLESMKTMQVVTDTSGIATANGFRSNDTRGAYDVRVMVMAAGQTGYTTIPRSNEGFRGPTKKTWWTIVAVAAALGAGGGTYLAVRGHSTAATKITTGGVAVGAP